MVSDLLLQDTNTKSEVHDVAVINGDLALITNNLDAVEQAIRQQLLLFYGEWFMDLSAGIPYIQTVFEKNPNLAALEAIFVDAILAVPGVIELLSFSIEVQNSIRLALVKFEVRTETGIITFNETVP